jgi:hypothetical protein
VGKIAQQWISEAEWKDYLASIETSERRWAKLARAKCRRNYDLGPFAFLVRDAALHGDAAGQKPYQTRGSQVFEIVCWDFEEVFGRPLLDEYRAATQPCFVVFLEPHCTPHRVRAALTYAHHMLTGLGMALHCNTNFDGNGKPVPREWINGIEWL